MQNKKCREVDPKTGLTCWQNGEHDDDPEGQHWAIPPAVAKDVTRIPRPVRWK